MKYIITILVLTSFPAFAEQSKNKETAAVATPVATEKVQTKRGDADPSQLRKQFEKETKIVPGEYILESNSNEACQDGKLGLVDYGDELAVILGARSLVVGLGKEKIEEIDETCKTIYRSSFKGNQVEENVEEDCGDGMETIKTVITFEKDKISYTKAIASNGTLIEEFKCISKLQKIDSSKKNK